MQGLGQGAYLGRIDEALQQVGRVGLARCGTALVGRVEFPQDALDGLQREFTLGRGPGEEKKRQVGVASAVCVAGCVEVPRRVPLVAGHKGHGAPAFVQETGGSHGHRLIAHVVGVLADIADYEYARRAGISRMGVLRHGLASLPARGCRPCAVREGTNRRT